MGGGFFYLQFLYSLFSILDPILIRAELIAGPKTFYSQVKVAILAISTISFARGKIVEPSDYHFGTEDSYHAQRCDMHVTSVFPLAHYYCEVMALGFLYSHIIRIDNPKD
jgi:hypothetical protein